MVYELLTFKLQSGRIFIFFKKKGKNARIREFLRVLLFKIPYEYSNTLNPQDGMKKKRVRS